MALCACGCIIVIYLFLKCYVLNIHVNDCVYIIPTMLTVLFYRLQLDVLAIILRAAAKVGHATYLEHFLSTPGIDVNIQDNVSY